MTEAVSIAETPLLSPDALLRFEASIGTSRCFLEYGAGGSTRLAARHDVPIIYSVESDRPFMRAVQALVQGSDTRSVLRVSMPPVGPTGPWGYPKDTLMVGRWPEYPLGVWDMIAQDAAMPDLILIDGRFRVACFLACLLHAAEGTTIFFDDYFGREHLYGVIERHARIAERVDRLAIVVAERVVDPVRLATDLARYCLDTH